MKTEESSENEFFDVAVIGAGPAGCMAAIQAGKARKSVALLERNSEIGKKLLLTGKGRCNVSNSAGVSDLAARFARHGGFYRHAFARFSSGDLSRFFSGAGLSLKTERQ